MRKVTTTVSIAVVIALMAIGSAFASPGMNGVGNGTQMNSWFHRHRNRCCCQKQTCCKPACETKCNTCNKCNKCNTCCKSKCGCQSKCGSCNKCGG